MRYLVPWLLIVLGLAIGIVLRSQSSWLTWLEVTSAAGAVVLALVAVAIRPGPRARRALLGALALVSLARGTHPRAAAPVPSATGFSRFRVLGASTPGPRCHATARDDAGARVELRLPAAVCPLAAGQSVFARGVSAAHGRPGGVTPSTLAAARGVEQIVYADEAWVVSPCRRPLWCWVATIRQRGWATSRGRPAMGFVASSLLGLKAALPAQEREHLRDAGLSHLVAVSGMHVGMAALVVQRFALHLALQLRRSIAVAIVIGLLPVIGYVTLTGASASSVRAACMHGLLGASLAVGRPAHGLHMLAVTAAVMLAARPAWLFDPGFQFSLAAMAALVTAPPELGMLGQTWRIAWAVMPLSLLYDGRFHPAGILANVVAIPIFTVWVAPLGAIGWFAQPWLGDVALTPAMWGAQTILEVARAVSSTPALPGWCLGAVAVIGIAVRWRPLRHSDDRDWLDGLAPPLLGAVATILVVGWSLMPTPVARPGSTFVTGSARRPTLVEVHEHGGACVRSPFASSSWPSLLSQLGVRHIRGLDEQAGPHRDAWIAAREREGLWQPQAHGCGPRSFEREQLAAWLDVCPTWVAAPTEEHPQARCWRDERWEPLPIDCSRQEAHGDGR